VALSFDTVLVGTCFMMDMGPSEYRGVTIPDGFSLVCSVELTIKTPCMMKATVFGHPVHEALHIKDALSHSQYKVTKWRHALDMVRT
jgi:hypothetical protein